VESQTEYLKTVNELEIEQREITRLEKVTESGAISGKLLLERRYAKEKLEASAKAQREALRMHGLSETQVDDIESTGKLLGELEIVAPDVDTHDHTETLRLSQVPALAATFKLSPPVPTSDDDHSSTMLVIDELKVHKGQGILAGERLCSLSDYSQLFIEGKAFENDISAINEAAKNGWPVDAVITSSSGREIVRGLKLAYVSNSIDAESRTLSMFVELPNTVVRDETNEEGQRFLAWKYRLGQRMELRVPVEVWEQQIVLPIDAVAKDGADWYVFAQKDKSFTRVAVHLQHRDQDYAVIANDGSISPGAIVARKSAHQMQMALKNLAGGAVDPHAGHNH
jgi:membrane fusion protein, heavy metal efflux system